MSMFERVGNVEGTGATYEWHGRRNPEQGPIVDLAVAPTCTNCSSPMQPVLGGYWCDSCESGAL